MRQGPPPAKRLWLAEGSDVDQQFLAIRYFKIKVCTLLWGFPGGSVVKNLPTNAGDWGSIPGSERSPGEGNGNPIQYSCLENSMDRGAWWAIVHGVTKSQRELSRHACKYYYGTMECVDHEALCIQCKGIIFILKFYFSIFKGLKWPLFYEIIFDQVKSWQHQNGP